MCPIAAGVGVMGGGLGVLVVILRRLTGVSGGTVVSCTVLSVPTLLLTPGTFPAALVRPVEAVSSFRFLGAALTIGGASLAVCDA